MSNIYAKDVGTLIQLDTNEDLSAVVAQKIYYQAPSGTKGDLSGVTVVETTKLQHTKTSTSLDSPGTWKLQAWVQWSSSDEYYGDIVELAVKEGLST